MIKLPGDLRQTGLAMPDSTPRTLIEVDSKNLPYAVQCPCCGDLFKIPEGLLYKIEDDALTDGDFDVEPSETEDTGSSVDIDVTAPSTSGSPIESSAEVGDNSDTLV